MLGQGEERAVAFVRLARVDLDDIYGLEKQCFACPWSRQQLASAFDLEIYQAFGLKGPSGLTAYMSFYHVHPEMEILNLAVRPRCQGLGQGRRLALAVLDVGRAMGLTRAFLEVAAGNQAALRLYASLGFSQVGRRAGYYESAGEDALLMARDL